MKLFFSKLRIENANAQQFFKQSVSDLMKSIYKLLIAASILILTTCTKSAEQHLGLWYGESHGQVGFLKLDAENVAYILLNGDTLGGANFEMYGNPVHLRYDVNYDVTPKTIDFIFEMADGGDELLRMPGIFKFNEAEEMVICLNFLDERRPEDFQENRHIYIKEG
jgi:hypothetical protein